MRKIWDKIVALLLRIPQDKWLHFIAGVLIGAFFGIALKMGGAAVVPVIFAAFAKDFFDLWTGEKFDWWDFAATTAGGVYISLCYLLAHIFFG